MLFADGNTWSINELVADFAVANLFPFILADSSRTITIFVPWIVSTFSRNEIVFWVSYSVPVIVVVSPPFTEYEISFLTFSFTPALTVPLNVIVIVSFGFTTIVNPDVSNNALYSSATVISSNLPVTISFNNTEPSASPVFLIVTV